MGKRNDIHKVLIIGSGPIIIGQACEFDYSGTQACKALRKLGYQIVLVNSNPATIMTDPGIADVTYIEPLNVERLEQIIAKERPDAILPNLGGQSGLSSQIRQNRVGAFLCDNLLQTLHIQRLDVGYIRDSRVRHNGRRIGVHQNNLIAKLAQRLARLRSGIIKLARLTNDDRTGTNNQYFMNIISLTHSSS